MAGIQSQALAGRGNRPHCLRSLPASRRRPLDKQHNANHRQSEADRGLLFAVGAPEFEGEAEGSEQKGVSGQGGEGGVCKRAAVGDSDPDASNADPVEFDLSCVRLKG